MPQKLYTQHLRHRFAQLGSQDGKGADALVVCKFFHPAAHATWFATEALEVDAEGGEHTPGALPATQVRDVLFFGWAELVPGCGEFGYFGLKEISEARGPLGLHVERDAYWSEKPVREAVKAFNGDIL